MCAISSGNAGSESCTGIAFPCWQFHIRCRVWITITVIIVWNSDKIVYQWYLIANTIINTEWVCFAKCLKANWPHFGNWTWLTMHYTMKEWKHLHRFFFFCYYFLKNKLLVFFLYIGFLSLPFFWNCSLFAWIRRLLPFLWGVFAFLQGPWKIFWNSYDPLLSLIWIFVVMVLTLIGFFKNIYFFGDILSRQISLTLVSSSSSSFLLDFRIFLCWFIEHKERS